MMHGIGQPAQQRTGGDHAGAEQDPAAGDTAQANIYKDIGKDCGH